MALPAREPSFDNLGILTEPWTAQLALDLLPENNGPKVEVVRGSVVVTPHANYDHQDIELELTYRLKRAARAVGLWAYLEVNVLSGDDLFIPDIVVLRRSGGGKKTMPIAEAVLLGEIVSSSNRRKDLIDRPREYAAAGVPYFLRIEFRNRVPGIVLHELREGQYQPVTVAAAGETFDMREPFAFSVDPVDLLGEEG
ncbi:Uma2 family endonuclease [Actinoplanes sp. NPDC049548]|uniref:Uma2 family endonuclease n=1 Tax=Actinoplanes sp. NPDC049548 TaxID=3155152 RepID=UPI00342425CF